MDNVRLSDEANARINKLRSRTGVVTPQQVVDDARDESSPLHQEFAKYGAWDDSHAAESYRVYLARKMIAVTVVVHHQVRAGQTLRVSESAPQVVHVPGREAGYMSVSDAARKSLSFRWAILRSEARTALSYLRRVQGLAEGLGLDVDVGAAVRLLERLEKEAGEEQAA